MRDLRPLMRLLEAGLAARLDTSWQAEPWKCADTWAYARVVSPDNGAVEISVDAPRIDPIRITVRHYLCKPSAPVCSVVETTWHALAMTSGPMPAPIMEVIMDASEYVRTTKGRLVDPRVRHIGIEVVADSVVAAVLNCIREGRVIALHAGEENA